MYYLRKKPYAKEYINSETGEKDYTEFTEDRAVFKHNRFGRMYRKNFLCTENGIHLWKCKTLQNALRHRVQLYHYCNEWFDVYDDETNESIPTDLYEEYEAPPFSKIWTTKTLYLNNNTGKVTDVKNFTEPYLYKTIRKGSKLNVYRAVDYYKMWQLDNIFEDQVICVNTAGDVIFKFADDADFMNCTDNDLFETYLDRKWKKEGKL